MLETRAKEMGGKARGAKEKGGKETGGKARGAKEKGAKAKIGGIQEQRERRHEERKIARKHQGKVTC